MNAAAFGSKDTGLFFFWGGIGMLGNKCLFIKRSVRGIALFLAILVTLQGMSVTLHAAEMNPELPEVESSGGGEGAPSSGGSTPAESSAGGSTPSVVEHVMNKGDEVIAGPGWSIGESAAGGASTGSGEGGGASTGSAEGGGAPSGSAATGGGAASGGTASGGGAASGGAASGSNAASGGAVSGNATDDPTAGAAPDTAAGMTPKTALTDDGNAVLLSAAADNGGGANGKGTGVATKAPAAALPDPDVIPAAPAALVYAPDGAQKTDTARQADPIVTGHYDLTGIIRVRTEEIDPGQTLFEVLNGNVTFRKEYTGDDGYTGYRYFVHGDGTHFFLIHTAWETDHSPVFVIGDKGTLPLAVTFGAQTPTDTGIKTAIHVAGEGIRDGSLTVTLKKGGTKDADGAQKIKLTDGTFREDGRYIAWAILPKELLGEEGVYALTATVKNANGEEAEKVMMYLVDRTGSLFLLDEATARLVAGHYTNKPPRIVLMHEGYERIARRALTMAWNGAVKTLREGESYRMRTTLHEGRYRDTYVIDAEQFQRDGLYGIGLYAEDAGTPLTSRDSDALIDFELDREAPVIVVPDIESGAVIHAAVYDLLIQLSDNCALRHIEITGDGEVLLEKELLFAGASDRIDLRLEESATKRLIAMTLQDAAGNEAVSRLEGILISSDALDPVPVESGIGSGTGSLLGVWKHVTGRTGIMIALFAVMTVAILSGSVVLHARVRRGRETGTDR